MSEARAQEALRRVLAGETLEREAVRAVLAETFAGGADPVAFGGLLVAMAARGETSEELLGGAQAMRDAMEPFEHDCPDAIDTCGTGGSGLDTFNVSTAGAIVAAAAGARVIKHGNRSASSKCGSADLLEALGVPLELDPDAARTVLQEVGITFLFAPRYHPAMRHAGPVRRSLGVRTLFNLLGPLCNPGRVQNQLLGVFDPGRLDDLARVLEALGTRRALVVHGAGGADELTLAGENRVAVVGDLPVSGYNPETLGLTPQALEASCGGDAPQNAATLRSLLDGEAVPPREWVAFNAGAALLVAGVARDLPEGYARAIDAIDSGAARTTLRRWCELGRQLEGATT